MLLVIMPLMIHNAPVYSAPQFANSTARGPYGDAVGMFVPLIFLFMLLHVF